MTSWAHERALDQVHARIAADPEGKLDVHEALGRVFAAQNEEHAIDLFYQLTKKARPRVRQ